MKMKIRKHFIGKYILIFILAFSVTTDSQLFPWQRRQLSPTPRSGYFQTANRPPVGRFSGIYGPSSGRAVPASRVFQNSQRQIPSSNNRRLIIQNNAFRTPTTRSTPLRQMRPATVKRINTPPFVRNNQNFSPNRVTPHPILRNRNVRPYPNNNFHPGNPPMSGDSFSRRIQNISPNINHPVSHNNQILTMPRLTTSSRASLQPPAGYKIAYCKIFNATHQLVTLTPLQQPSPQVIRRVPHSGTRINYSPIQNNIIPRRQPTRYVMVRTEDYVVCSHPSPTPSTFPVYFQSGRTSVIRPNSVPVAKPVSTTLSPLVHKQFVPTAIRTSSHNEQLPRQIPSRVSQNTRNTMQTRKRVPLRPRGQINRSFSNSQNNRFINANFMAKRPFSSRNLPRNFVPKSAYTFKPPVPYFMKNIPHNIPANNKKPTNLFSLPNPFSVLSDTTTELSNLFSGFLKTLKKLQVPTSAPQQLNHDINTRTSQTRNTNHGVNLSKGSDKRTNRPRTMVRTSVRPKVTTSTKSNTSSPQQLNRNINTRTSQTQSSNRALNSSKGFNTRTNRPRTMIKNSVRPRTTTSTKSNTTSKPRSTTTTSRPRTLSPPPRVQPPNRRPPIRRRRPLRRRPKSGRRPTLRRRPSHRRRPLRRRPSHRSRPPWRRPRPRPVQNERVRIYIPPSLRKEIDNNKDELLKLEEEALEEEEEIVEIEEEKEEEREEEEAEEAEYNNSTKPSPRRRSVRSKNQPQNLGINKPQRFSATKSFFFE